jgi:hypothetical protein
LLRSLALLLCGPLLSATPTDVTGQRETSKHPASPEQVYLIIRSDDAGMSHSVNMALEKLGLGMSQYFGDTRYDPQYSAAPRDKTDSLVAMIDRLKPRFNLVITHVGIDDAELGALVDMNTSGPLPDMSKNRQGELDALMSQRFRDALKARNIQLLTYRQLIAMQGLNSMRRPEG